MGTALDVARTKPKRLATTVPSAWLLKRSSL